MAILLFFNEFLKVTAAPFDFPIAISRGFLQAGVGEAVNFFRGFTRGILKHFLFAGFSVDFRGCVCIGAWFFLFHIP